MSKSFKSEAQRQKLIQMVKDGKISQDQYNKMHLATLRGGKALPDRVKPKAK